MGSICRGRRIGRHHTDKLRPYHASSIKREKHKMLCASFVEPVDAMIVLLFTVTVVFPCRIRRTRGCVIAVKSRPASARSRCAGGRATANTRKHECMHEQPRIVDETFSRNDELVSRQDADSAASPLLVLTKGQPAARRRGRGGVRGGGRAGPMTGGLCRGRGGRAQLEEQQEGGRQATIE